MEIIEIMSVILPVLAFLGVIFLVIINLYKKIRRKFPIKVNCWFCNEWSKIDYDLQNCFTCPKCEQYNGFSQDGDYNRVIPEQHDEFLNKNLMTKCKNYRKNDNGLCNICNNNQRLKIHQLAVFSPIDENNFDDEIEKYELQLERAYPLCSSCQKVVTKTLRSQKSLLLGLNLSNSKNGFDFLNFSTELKTAKKNFLINAVRIFIVILALIEIFQNVKDLFKFFKMKNPLNLGSVITIKEIFLYLLNFVKNNFLFAIFENTFLANFILLIFESFQKFLTIPLIGLFFESTLLVFQKNITKTQFLRLFLWTFNIFLYEKSSGIYKFLEIVSSLALIFIKKLSPKIENDNFEFSSSNILSSTPEKCSQNLFKLENNSKLNGLKFNGGLNFNVLLNNDGLKSPVFGDKPIFENPLSSKVSYRKLNDSFDQKSIFNASLTAGSILNDTLNSNEGLNLDLSINEKLNGLHLSTYQISNKNELPKAFKIYNAKVSKPKPVLSPPKLGNLTYSSWLAGGYWKNNNDFSTLSRSSSQSSGFGSQTSTQNLENFNSLPPSRNNSICGEIDRFSVLSEPIMRPRGLESFHKNSVGPDKIFGPEHRSFRPEIRTFAPEKRSYGLENNAFVPIKNVFGSEKNFSRPERSSWLEKSTYGSEKNSSGPKKSSYGPEKSFMGLESCSIRSRGNVGRENFQKNSPFGFENYFIPINPQKNSNLDHQISNLNITKPILSENSEIYWGSGSLGIYSQNLAGSAGSVKSYSHHKNNGIVKGSLLQKWREQNGFD